LKKKKKTAEIQSYLVSEIPEARKSYYGIVLHTSSVSAHINFKQVFI
jgi:hypothetical protein